METQGQGTVGVLEQPIPEDQTPKRSGGAPTGNSNNWKHGLYSAKTKLMRFGKRALNLRTRAGMQWKAYYVEFLSIAAGIPVSKLRGEPQIRAAKKKLSRIDIHEIESLASEAWMLQRVDADLVQAPSLVRGRREKHMIPLIAQRNALASAYEQRREDFRRRFQKPVEEKPLLGWLDAGNGSREG